MTIKLADRVKMWRIKPSPHTHSVTAWAFELSLVLMKIDVDIESEILESARTILKAGSPQETIELAIRYVIDSHNGTEIKPRKIQGSLHPSAKQSPFFGQFLVQNQIINLEELNGAIQFMRKNNPRVGDLAVKKGYLSALQAQDLHREQRTVDMFFGDLAVHKGLMTQEELDEVLSHQKKNRIRLGDAIVLLGFSDVETIERYAGEFHSFIEKQAQDREQRQEQGTPETNKLEQYLLGYLPKMLERLADVQARAHKLGSLVPEHLEEFHGQVELRGLNVCTLSVSLDIVLIHHILVGLFSADYEQIFDEPPYEDAISEFLSMLAASTASQLEKSGFEYKSSTPTVGAPPQSGTTICVETTVGRGIVVFGFSTSTAET